MSIWRTLAEAGADLAGQVIGAVGGGGPDRCDVAFTIALIALAAKIAKADGAVTDAEIAAFQEIFEIPPGEADNVRRVYRLAMQDVAGFRHYARQIGRLYRDRPGVLEDVLDALFHIAKADRVIHPREIDFLADVADAFGFTAAEFRRLKASHLEAAGGADDPYAVLGVTPEISDEDLKRAYRKIVRENHPDALQGRGVPPEFRRLSEAKLAAINAAYERITAERARRAPANVN